MENRFSNNRSGRDEREGAYGHGSREDDTRRSGGESWERNETRDPWARREGGRAGGYDERSVNDDRDRYAQWQRDPDWRRDGGFGARDDQDRDNRDRGWSSSSQASRGYGSGESQRFNRSGSWENDARYARGSSGGHGNDDGFGMTQGSYGQRGRGTYGESFARTDSYGQRDFGPTYGSRGGNDDYNRSYGAQGRFGESASYGSERNEPSWATRFGREVSHLGERLGQAVGNITGGRGPKGYKRSDDRIHEDVNEALSDHHELDASDVEVKVQNGEVTLTGTVGDRRQKRLAEQLLDNIRGIDEVHNQLRVKREAEASSGTSAMSASATGSSARSTGPSATQPTQNNNRTS